MTRASSRLPHAKSLFEWGARQIYWRTWRWVDPLRRRWRRDPATLPMVTADAFATVLAQCIPWDRGPFLVHASVGHFSLVDRDGQPFSELSAAAWLVAQLKQYVGPEGTLSMPTHPRYAANPGFMYDKSTLHLTYDVRRTPSGVGLLSELFRRQPGTCRSLHPLSSVAARGPLADELLANNLNDQRPLPHGRFSPYCRICQQGGTVIGLGLDLIKALTILHVAEEVRDEDWPVAGFFYERKFAVIDASGSAREVVVRERRPEFVRSLVLSQVRRDLLREGLMTVLRIDGVPLAIVDARGVLEFMQDRQRRSTYPYLWPGVARWGTPKKAESMAQGKPVGSVGAGLE